MADHIEIVKEDVVKQYKFRSNPYPPRPKPRNQSEHGVILKDELSNTIKAISDSRRRIGIQTDKLLVIELLTDAISPDILENMLHRFSLSLVEETIIPNTKNSKLLIQFDDKLAIDRFEQERAMWERNDTSNGALTYYQRKEFFSCIEKIRNISLEDRMGQRLKNIVGNEQQLPVGMFTVNIDIWYNGDRAKIVEIEKQIKSALGTQGSKLLGDLFELPSLLLGRALVNEFTLNALLEMDIIALVDLPMGTIITEQCELYAMEANPIVENELDEYAPLATVLDSGVFTGNPMLSSLIVGEEDFDQTESTTSDLNGHGTGVAGIVAYGEFTSLENTSYVFKPLVRICNGKIMHNDNKTTCYIENKRPEQIVKEAIEYFHTEYHCRVFNLSSGNADYIYNGGRQMPWAAMLDQLIQKLDIIVVVSTGNISDPNIPEFTSREELQQKCRDQLFSPENRLIDPATTALGITVGAITRYSEPDNAGYGITRLSVGKKDYMSVFTRIGEGIGGAVKPEFVDYGGNFALHQMPRGKNRWHKNDRLLMEPTLNHTLGKIFKGYNGTSFAAPHVTHIAARLERAIEMQIGESPSANLIKALLVSSAKYPPSMLEWINLSKDPVFVGKKIPHQAQKLRLAGYGKVDDSVLFSGIQQVTLFAEDDLNLRSLHLYKIPVPIEFIKIKNAKRIAIGFSYNPPTYLNRKSYLANNLWVEVFRRIETDILLDYIAKKETSSEQEAENIIDHFRQKYGADFHPGHTEIRNSALQQLVWEKGPRGGSDLLWSDSEPYIYVLITGKEHFKYTDISIPQKYALAITFSYDADNDIGLYQKLQAKARLKHREKIMTRIRV
jgi:hypothetical protein